MGDPPIKRLVTKLTEILRAQEKFNDQVVEELESIAKRLSALEKERK